MTTETTQTNLSNEPTELAENFSTPERTSLYLLPELLTANESNEKARPAETADERAARVTAMAASIVANGKQLQPVLVVEISEMDALGDQYTRYEYVDGGCRVEAIAKLNETEKGPLRTVWCSVVDASRDLFRDAVISNLHRTQNNLLELAMLCQEVRERNGWKGRGTETKVAAYLGMLPSRVTEYTKLLNAPENIKQMIRSGELQSLDAVLKLMAMEDEARPKVIERSKQIAKEEAQAEAAAKAEKKAKGKKSKAEDTADAAQDTEAEGSIGEKLHKSSSEDDAASSESTESVLEGKASSEKPEALAAPIKSRHIDKATREVTETAGPIKRTRGEIIAFFEQVTEAAYPKHVVAFTDAFAKWAAGELKTDAVLLKKFDAACGINEPASKPRRSMLLPPKPAKFGKAAKVTK